MRRAAFVLLICLMSSLRLPAATDWRTAPASDWQELFNGRNLDGWVVKLAHHEVGDNYGDTFRVENGLIRVMYDKYTEFGARFGHLFYKQKLSHYVVSVEYRFFGEQMKGGPSYARLNSGVMIHSQAPETILKDQDWPISVEAQLLAGNRTTMNVCTPGTEIFMHGEMVKAHCTNSTSKIYPDTEWVKVEVEVLGAERVRHIIDGQTVLEYEKPMIGGGVANGYDPAIKKDGTILEEGYIALQAESQPVEFRNVRLLNLSGCMDPTSPAYRSYFVHRDDSRCTPRKDASFAWPTGKRAALSLSFDDARPTQLDAGVPVFAEFQTHVTFYLTAQNIKDRGPDWRRAAAAGHELANHTTTHPCTGNFAWSRSNALEDYTLDRMRAEMLDANRAIAQATGVTPVTFAYPCGQTFVGRGGNVRSYAPLVSELFLAGRGWLGEGPNDPAFVDLSQLLGYPVDDVDFDRLQPVVDDAIARGQWLVLAGHDIGTTPAHQLTRAATLRALLTYVREPSRGVWVDTIADVASYVKGARR